MKRRNFGEVKKVYAWLNKKKIEEMLIIVNSSLFKFLKIFLYLSDNFEFWRIYSL